MIVLLLAALTVLSPRASAQNMDDVRIDHEQWKIVGWNDACGVAFEHLYFPALGDAIQDEPISSRIGTAVIAPGKEEYTARWVLEADGARSWSDAVEKKIVKELHAAGYTRPGWQEIVQTAVGNQPLLAETIQSTATLHARATKGWPDADWRWAGAAYNPLATCALLVFEKRDAPKRYRLFPVRVYNARLRHDRAYAHASNARLLFNAGDLDSAVVEAKTAAELDPDLGVARYVNAAMMSVTGQTDAAVQELSAAVKLDAKFGAQAADDQDFSELRRRDDFKALLP